MSQQQLEELHQLYMRVSELEQLKTDMIRIAAHDLRNPLGVVKGYTELLLEDTANAQRRISSILSSRSQQSAQKMLKIINDILSLQRIEAMQQNRDQSEINLAELMHDVFAGNESRAQQKTQAYRLVLPESNVPAYVDLAQLREAMDNLIGNAIKYTPASGSVTVRLETVDDRVIFEVEDTGLGIPEDQQARLFQPFFRASNAKTSAD